MLPSMTLLQAIASVVTAGLITHSLYKKYEFPLSRPFVTFFFLIAVPFVSSAFLFRHVPAAIALTLSFTIFYTTLLLSIATYRASPWHPLAKYPGPILAKLSILWLVRATVSGKYHMVLKHLHSEYGPYVRIGPNELSFADADLIPKILGPNGMPKGPMFDGARMPGVPSNVIATRDLADHTQKRKPWSRALSTASVREYAPAIVRRALQLAEELEKHSEKKENIGEGESSVNLAMWISRFAFDFMGDMAFGGGFELMREGDVTGIWTMIDQQMKAQAILQRLPWSAHALHKLPVVVAGMAKFTKFVNDCINQRKERGPLEKDLFYHLVNEEAGPSAFPSHDMAVEEGKLAIVAGSDTAATTMSGVFFYLLANPEVLARLRVELDEAFPPGEGDPFDLATLAELPILNAVINETLRLQPPVPTDLQRAPAAGCGSKRIGEHIIVEGTAINVPPYVLHRDPRYFSPIPDTFWPDRWLQTFEKNSRIITNTAAFIPFSFGPANCAGKMLALAEMRSVIALLLQRFDMRFAKGYDARRWEAELENNFVMKVGNLPVVLTARVI
ncbi:high nitrogen upregulated cytochrome P450 monooxygenase 1 [Phellopilus nigrolimitatus]|nr:high nitrogen upregulated cytochrome P450 monooxygenase 1 [Phellopilus nigrolimitatus]